MGNKRILVVEDSLPLLKSIEEILTAENYVTFTASDPETAWKTFLQQLPDLVITDVNLESADASDQSGIALMQKISQQQDSGKACPVILMSSDPSAMDRLTDMSPNQLDFLAKPFDPKALLDSIATHISSNS